jgi:hypothetical protein
MKYNIVKELFSLFIIMPKSVDKYHNERKEVFNKMMEILGINENNNMFSLHKIDANIEKQNQIIELENDIKKYFLCGEWTCFKKKDTVKRRWLSMIKYVVKDMEYNFFNKRKNSNPDDKNIYDTYYYIILG